MLLMLLPHSRRHRVAVRVFACILSFAAAAPAAAQSSAASAAPGELVVYPDLVLYNGKILTVDPQFTIAEAVAARDGRVLTVGSNADVKRLIGPTTRAIDLQGKSVVPGFIDSDGDNAFAGGD